MIQDKRYKRTEEQILRFFFECKGNVTIERIAEKLGVPRSTIYRHHHSIKAIVDDYVGMMKSRCNIICGGGKEKDIKKFYLELLFFIVRNRHVFLLFLKVENKEVLLMILYRNKRELLKCADFRFEADKAFNIYCKEVIEVIRMWGEKGFSQHNIEVVLKDILYLTKTLKIRLGPLCNS